MHARVARLPFPTRDALDLRRRLERFEQRPAVHVLTDRQTEKREHRRREVDQARAIDALVPPDA